MFQPVKSPTESIMVSSEILQIVYWYLLVLQLRDIFNVLEAILLTCSEDNSLEGVGMYIVNKILTNHIKLLYSAMSTSCPSDLTIAALKLITSFVAQGTKGVRDVLTYFDFTLKGIETVARKRDKKVSTDSCFRNFIFRMKRQFGQPFTAFSVAKKGAIGTLPWESNEVATQVISTK